MSSALRRRSALITVVAVCTLAFGGLASAAAANAAASACAAGLGAALRADIAGTLPSWASVNGREAAPAVTKGTVNADIYLAGRDLAGLNAYAAAVSTPGNALYRHYLSPSQVRAGSARRALRWRAIEAWVRSAGLRVTGVDSQMAGYVSVTGSVAGREPGLRRDLRDFQGSRRTDVPRTRAGGERARLGIASSVLTIGGLDTAPHLVKPMTCLPRAGTTGSPSPAPYYGQKIATNEPPAYGASQPWTNCGYTQAQIRSAYGVTASGMTGKGQTVAVVDAYASPTMPGDANKFATVTGDKPFRPGQYEQTSPALHARPPRRSAARAGWYGEETLDIEAVHGQAPDANVRYVASRQLR